ncbi:MAG: PH domain-containing protein [Micromonosporaceae bacterium]|nr:PH domain-containing protein [Micromonosporaceae bacterium]
MAGGNAAGDGRVLEWRVQRKLPVVKLAAAAVFALLGLAVASDLVGRSLAAVAAAGLGAYAVRDLVFPVRLRADAEGVTLVTGVARRRRLPWSQVDRVRVDERHRLGLRTELLEIDIGDELLFLSERDLGVPPAEALAALAPLSRSGH